MKFFFVNSYLPRSCRILACILLGSFVPFNSMAEESTFKASKEMIYTSEVSNRGSESPLLGSTKMSLETDKDLFGSFVEFVSSFSTESKSVEPPVTKPSGEKNSSKPPELFGEVSEEWNNFYGPSLLVFTLFMILFMGWASIQEDERRREP